MYFLDLLLLIFVFFFVGYIAFLFICILDLSLLMSGFFFRFLRFLSAILTSSWEPFSYFSVHMSFILF